MNDHRYDPSEIYSDELLEEFKNIPDPKKEPLDFLNQFTDVLDEFGPWAADRAALNLLLQIEKAKVKTPYERNFLLLCMVSTTFMQIRAHCEHVFQSLPSEKHRIETYSSPKVLRVLEVLKLFAPEKKDEPKKVESEFTKSTLNELNAMDFKSVTDGIDVICDKLDKVTIGESHALKKNLHNLVKPDQNLPPNAMDGDRPVRLTQQQRFRSFRNRKLPTQRPPRPFNNHHQNDPDALSGLIFCNSKFIAKILYSLFYEMSKNDPQLDYLTVQYTVDRTADPITETKQAENEHRKQEEVLKRFRMHGCNLLIGTAVLEEGIELPKCNLVIRWDAPTTYRSYVQCKGRARSHHAYHVIMVAPFRTTNSETKRELLTRNSHRQICAPGQKFLERVLAEGIADVDDKLQMNGDSMHGIMESDEALNTSDDSQVVSDISSSEMTNGETNHQDQDSDSGQHSEDPKDKVREPDIFSLIKNYKCHEAEHCEGNDDDNDDIENTLAEKIVPMEKDTEEFIERLAQYREIEKVSNSICSRFQIVSIRFSLFI